jgi:hypothetical protein
VGRRCGSKYAGIVPYGERHSVAGRSFGIVATCGSTHPKMDDMPLLKRGACPLKHSVVIWSMHCAVLMPVVLYIHHAVAQVRFTSA